MDGAVMTFICPELILTPAVPNMQFIYSANLASGETLPTGLISFDQVTRIFTVSSTDQSLNG